jgi:nitrate/nitrite transporter NarK
MPMIKDYFHLTDAQVKALLMLNVAITIPTRILIGVLVDKYGPRKSYSFLLAFCGVLCLAVRRRADPLNGWPSPASCSARSVPAS